MAGRPKARIDLMVVKNGAVPKRTRPTVRIQRNLVAIR
ncbi:unnamed protein product, partial [marine sediment metagenome]